MSSRVSDPVFSVPDDLLPTRDPLIFRRRRADLSLEDFVPTNPLHYDVVYFDPTGSKGRTLQGPAIDTDINVIVGRMTPGVVPAPVTQGYYGDATRGPQSLAEAMSFVHAAGQAFDRLPAQVRLSMGNDPRNLESWLSNPDNLAVARKYGLISPAPSPAPAAGPPPAPTPTPAPAQGQGGAGASGA